MSGDHRIQTMMDSDEIEFERDGAIRLNASPMTFAASPSTPDYSPEVIVRYLDGAELKFSDLKKLQEDERFSKIVQDIDDGKVFAVNFSILSFVDEENAGHVRPGTGAIKALARSSKDKPVLQDHRAYDSNAEVGVILSSESAKVDNKESLLTRVSARTREFQRAYVSGLRRRYSAGLVVDLSTCSCTACGGKMESVDSGYGYSTWRLPCGHRRGQVVEMSDGTRTKAELLFKKAELFEVSTTPAPAIKSARALGQTLSMEGIKMPDVSQPQTMGSKAAELEVKLSEVTAERDRLMSTLQRSSELNVQLALETLKAERILVGTEHDADAREYFSAVGIERGLAFYRKQKPQLQFSSERFGSDSANAEPAAPPKPTETEIAIRLGNQEAKSLREAAEIMLGIKKKGAKQ